MAEAEDLGLDWYASTAEGAGGELKQRPEDFVVQEIEDYSYGGEGKHAVLRITLTNKETHEFARDLSNALGVSRKRVSWAGTKDKRAVTTQLFTVAGVSQKDVEGLDMDAEIEYLGRSHHPIRLGDLLGNRFSITVRGLEKPGNIGRVANELEEFVGVPNLFGVQRFGARRPITHRVGEHILMDDFQGAVNTYLTMSFSNEPNGTREARERLSEEGDYGEALKYFPERLQYEHALLNELVQDKSYRGALEALPRNLRRLFVNAVQSRLFNLMLRARYREGLRFDQVYVGDVVCFQGDHGFPDTDRLQIVTESNKDAVKRHVGRGRAYITAPLVGSETELSGGLQGGLERAVLEGAGISLGDFDRDDLYGSSGTRRPVLMNPDIQYDVGDSTAEFEFMLPKGSYATVVLREFLDG